MSVFDFAMTDDLLQAKKTRLPPSNIEALEEEVKANDIDDGFGDLVQPHAIIDEF